MEEQHVQILDNETDAWTVIRDISRSEAQEDAFYVCDLGNIVQKYRIWKTALPRVQPFYGEYGWFREKFLDLATALATFISTWKNQNYHYCYYVVRERYFLYLRKRKAKIVS